ncbi:disease resistance protein RPM1-like [Nymphaea colorata]|uniref:AAA+ ATPase domain-containing protein n=1 Tax=Nymphaea colorata TaxID=210225 RepID=A0A5K1BRY1_9MAGN|nr:disease resistance protein RPM1-like [Nymphaea colorata]
MAEIAVGFLLQRLERVLADEANLSTRVHHEVNALKIELEKMRSFLTDADSRQSEDAPEQAVETWVEQVRRAAFDSEDIIDEFILHFGEPNGTGFMGSLRRVYRSITRWRERHNLQGRVMEMRETIRVISETRVNWLNLNQSREGSSSKGADLSLRLDLPAEIAEDGAVVGIEHEIKKVKDFLVGGGKELTTILLHGGAGMGKTTLAKKAYNDYNVRSHFDCRAWVTVSKSFRPRVAIHSMLKGFYNSSKEMFPSKRKVEEDVEGMTLELNMYLKQRRYLLVLDDVWGADVLERLTCPFPSDNCGSRILVTSRDPCVVSTIERWRRERAVIPVIRNSLPAQDSMDLFCSKAFRGGICPPNLVDCCQKLVDKCGGWPIAIVTLAAAMSRAGQSPTEWNGVHDHLGFELGANQDFHALTKVISLSYDELPLHLKTCFLYCVIFPRDYSIKVNKLIRLWAAEGFIERRPGLAVEELGKQYLQQLIDRSLLQIVGKNDKGRVNRCKMHDLVREWVLRISSKQWFLNVISVYNGNEGDEGENQRSRRLSLHGAGTEYLGQFASEQLQRIRSFFMFGAPDCDIGVIHRFLLMRVLDLQDAPINELPNAIGGLFHLRYLNLRRTRLRRLPASIKKLHNLEALDIRDNLIERLPNISKMRMLRYVSAYSHLTDPFTLIQLSLSGCDFPSEICTCRCMRKLWGINATDKIVEAVGNLNQLKHLGIRRVKEEHGRRLCRSIERMKELLSLSISCNSEDEYLKLESLASPPPYLEDVWMFGRLKMLPSWFSQLENLKRLGLHFCKLAQNPLFSLQAQLPNLLWLKLYDAFEGRELRCYTNSFLKLETLIIMNLRNLRSIVVDEQALPSLQTLSICRCSELRRLPPRIFLTPVLIFKDMHEDFTRNIQVERGEDMPRIIIR